MTFVRLYDSLALRASLDAELVAAHAATTTEPATPRPGPATAESPAAPAPHRSGLKTIR